MIHLRRHQPHDMDACYEAVRESFENLSKWMPWCHPGYSREDSVIWNKSRDQAWEARQALDFNIVDDRDRLLGVCGLNRIDWINETANLGYWVRSAAQNRGVATTAVGHLRDIAFHDFGLHRLEILVAVDNRASQRVAEKSGATREALLRNRLLLNGRRHDAVLFAIVRRGPTIGSQNSAVSHVSIPRFES